MIKEPEWWDICHYINICDEADFLIMAARYESEKIESLDWLYKLGKDYNILDVSYDEFLVRGPNAIWNERYRRYYPQRRYCLRRHYQTTKYVKNTSHEKKEKNTKNIWREVSGINRDKRKVSYSRRGTYKANSPTKHRAWRKQQIHNENWEALGDYNEYRQFWEWD